MKRKATNATINVRCTEITVIHQEDDDLISLTDMVRNFDGGDQLHNPDFITPKFEGIKCQAGRTGYSFTLKQLEGGSE